MGRRLLLEWIAIAVVVVGLVCALVATRATESFDNLLYDLALRQTPHEVSDQIVIIAMDEASQAQIGRWPWSREVHAQALARLQEARPAAVIYDVLFIEPSTAAADVQLGAAITALGRVYLPILFVVPGADGAPFALMPPLAQIGRGAAGTGHVSLQFDKDGIARRVNLIQEDGRRAWPHMAEVVYRAIQGRPSKAFEQAAHAPAAGDQLSASRTILIPYVGPSGTFPTYSFISLLRGEVLPELLRGKVLIVGSTAAGSGDQYPTPTGHGSSIMPGAEITANILNGLLGDRVLRVVDGVGLAIGASLLVLVLLVFLLRLSPRGCIALTGGLLALTLATAYLLLAWADVWAPPGAAMAGLILAYPLWAWRRLEAVNAYTVSELRRLSEEPDPLSHRTAPARPKGDPLAIRMELLQEAVGRVRELRRLFSNALQALPDPAFIVNDEGQILIANDAGDQLSLRLLGMVPPRASLPMIMSRLSGKDGVLESREIEGADGAAYLFTTVRLSGEGPDLGFSIARFANVTSIRSSARQRETMLQLLTHDMRSPQASILALLEHAAGQKDSPAPDFVRRIAGYARRTLKLADDFVLLSRAESTQYAMEVINLSDVLIEAVDELWPQATKSEIEIHTLGIDLEARIIGDRNLLTRALINLLDNAIKYSPARGEIRCSLTVDEAAEQVVCEIRDRGAGIAAAELATLYEPFRRTAAGHRINAKGAGLGLSFVRTVVLRHRGVIVCESEPKVGTTFRITLPLETSSVDLHGADEIAEGPSASSARAASTS